MRGLNSSGNSRQSRPSAQYRLLLVIALTLLTGCSTNSLQPAEELPAPVPIVCRGVVDEPTPINPSRQNDAVRYLRQLRVVNEWHREGLIDCQARIDARLKE